MEIIQKYFNDFDEKQLVQLQQLKEIYSDWNEKINVISRKDIEHFYLHHVLHSLSIAAVVDFDPKHRIIDIGTGGGFPGIPLAIFFPQTEFLLVDSIRKKLNVVNEVASALQINNITTHWGRTEEIKQKNSFDFAVSRAVAPLGSLWAWGKNLIRKGEQAELANGLICLKGGNLHQEISESQCRPMLWDIYKIFAEEYFTEKYILHVRK